VIKTKDIGLVEWKKVFFCDDNKCGVAEERKSVLKDSGRGRVDVCQLEKVWRKYFGRSFPLFRLYLLSLLFRPHYNLLPDRRSYVNLELGSWHSSKRNITTHYYSSLLDGGIRIKCGNSDNLARDSIVLPPFSNPVDFHCLSQLPVPGKVMLPLSL